MSLQSLDCTPLEALLRLQNVVAILIESFWSGNVSASNYSNNKWWRVRLFLKVQNINMSLSNIGLQIYSVNNLNVLRIFISLSLSLKPKSEDDKTI